VIDALLFVAPTVITAAVLGLARAGAQIYVLDIDPLNQQARRALARAAKVTGHAPTGEGRRIEAGLDEMLRVLQLLDQPRAMYVYRLSRGRHNLKGRGPVGPVLLDFVAGRVRRVTPMVAARPRG